MGFCGLVPCLCCHSSTRASRRHCWLCSLKAHPLMFSRKNSGVFVAVSAGSSASALTFTSSVQTHREPSLTSRPLLTILHASHRPQRRCQPKHLSQSPRPYGDGGLCPRVTGGHTYSHNTGSVDSVALHGPGPPNAQYHLTQHHDTVTLAARRPVRRGPEAAPGTRSDVLFHGQWTY